MSYQKNWDDDIHSILRLSTDYTLLLFTQNRDSKAITSYQGASLLTTRSIAMVYTGRGRSLFLAESASEF
jgi:hypothetical protein